MSWTYCQLSFASSNIQTTLYIVKHTQGCLNSVMAASLLSLFVCFFVVCLGEVYGVFFCLFEWGFLWSFLWVGVFSWVFFFFGVYPQIKANNQCQLRYCVQVIWLLFYSIKTRKFSFYMGYMKFQTSHLNTEMGLIKAKYLVFYPKCFSHHFSHSLGRIQTKFAVFFYQKYKMQQSLCWKILLIFSQWLFSLESCCIHCLSLKL